MTDEEDGELSLGAITRYLWRHRMIVVAGGLVGAIISGVIAFTMQPYFKAEIVVTDVRDRDMGGRTSMIGTELSGLASSITGVDLSQAGAQSEEAAAVLDSHHLAAEFITRNSLLPVLMPHSRKPPTLWLAVKAFKENVLSIRKDTRKGVTAVTIQWTDPALAASWANEYLALANELIRSRAQQDASRNIAYLTEQLARTGDVELRKVMYSIIEDQTKTLMLANGRKEYAFEIVDPAVAPELKAGPHRLLRTIIGLVVGFAVAGLLTFAWEGIGRLRRQSAAG
jgi:uncharacterized protein involved in exopolysaccharide biosynthesis